MPPRESDPLLFKSQFSVDETSLGESQSPSFPWMKWLLLAGMGGVMVVAFPLFHNDEFSTVDKGFGALGRKATGPYRLLERQVGSKFFEHYEFYDGADSIGSAGYQTYVGEKRALQLNLANVTVGKDGQEFVYMQSVAGAGKDDLRESVRLEGKRRFNRGLFILDVGP